MDIYVNEFTRNALRPTVENALAHPFYGSLWKDVFPLVQSDTRTANFEALLHTFSRLPTLSRSHLARDLRPTLANDDSVATILHTTGTTGEVAYRYRSAQDLALLKDLMGERLEHGSSPISLGANLYGPYHGQSFAREFQANTNTYVFDIAVWEDIFVKMASNLLLKEFNWPNVDRRVSSLSGAVRLVRTFTQCLIDQGITADQTAITSLFTYAGHVPLQTKRYLQDYWNVAPVSVFSISEASGSAPICPKCGFLAFAPHLFPQLARMGGHSDGAGPLGRLLLTELFPFSRSQPLVRYETGDLVQEIDESSACCREHVGGLRHVGRERGSILLPGQPAESEPLIILGSNQMRDLVHCAEIAKSSEFVGLTVLKDRSLLGDPFAKFELSVLEDSRYRLELRFLPSRRGRERADAELIRERALATVPSLENVVRNGRVEWSVVPDYSVLESIGK